MKTLVLALCVACMCLSLYNYITYDMRHMIFFGILSLWNLGNLILYKIGEGK